MKKKKITMDDFMRGKVNRKKYIGKHLIFDPNTLELVAYGKNVAKALKMADKKGVKSPTCIFVDS
jgi:hypothetical protein